MNGMMRAIVASVLLLLASLPLRAQDALAEEPAAEQPADLPDTSPTELTPPQETTTPPPAVVTPAAEVPAAPPAPLDLAVYGSTAWQRLWILSAVTAVPSLLVLTVPVLVIACAWAITGALFFGYTFAVERSGGSVTGPEALLAAALVSVIASGVVSLLALVAGPLAYLAVRVLIPWFLPLPGDRPNGKSRTLRAERFLIWDLVVHGAAAVSTIAGGVVLGGAAAGTMVFCSLLAPFSACLLFCLPIPQVGNRLSGNWAYSATSAPAVMALVGLGICLGSAFTAQAATPLLALWPKTRRATVDKASTAEQELELDDAEVGAELEAP